MLKKSDIEFITRYSPGACVRIIQACVNDDVEEKSDLWKRIICPDFCDRLVSDTTLSRDFQEVLSWNLSETAVMVMKAFGETLGPERFSRLMDLKSRRTISTQVGDWAITYMDKLLGNSNGCEPLEKKDSVYMKKSRKMLEVILGCGASPGSILADCASEVINHHTNPDGSRCSQKNFIKKLKFMRQELRIRDGELLTPKSAAKLVTCKIGSEARRWILMTLDNEGFDFSVFRDKSVARRMDADAGALVQSILARQMLSKNHPAPTKAKPRRKDPA